MLHVNPAERDLLSARPRARIELPGLKGNMVPRRVVMIVLCIALGTGVAACAAPRSLQDPGVSATIASSRLMPDGKRWTTENLNLKTDQSYCYADAELNCGRYGRLYTWESAQRVCQALGDEWRLPTDDDWRQLAKHFGGVSGDSDDRGRAAYQALLIEGRSGFNALLGGGRTLANGEYTRGEAHGFYWTASESDSANAWFYNFARGSLALYRQPDGEKPRAFSVRCVRA